MWYERKVERSGHMWSVALVSATATTMLWIVDGGILALMPLVRRKLRAFVSLRTQVGD